MREILDNLRTRHKILLIIVTLGILTYPNILQVYEYTQDHTLIYDDARPLYPFYRYYDASLFKDDYVSDNSLSGHPIGFFAIKYLAAQFIDPYIFDRTLVLFLYPILVVGMGFASWRLGGPLACWGTLLLVLSGNLYLTRMIGGASHAYAFPLLACMMAALLWGKPYLFSIVTILSAAFYPPVTPIIGLTMAGYLLLLPRRMQEGGAEWGFIKRFVLLAVTAILAFVLILPVLGSGEEYGPKINPIVAAEQYPEFGEKGGMTWEAGSPIKYFIFKVILVFSEKYGTVGLILMASLGFLIIFFGFIFCSVGIKHQRKKLAILLVFVIALFVLASIFAPIFRYRFMMYPFAMLYFLMLPSAMLYILRAAYKKRLPQIISFVLLSLIYVHTFTELTPSKAGYWVEIEPDQLPVYEFITSQSAEKLFAGWTGNESYIIENVPYYAKRKALLTFETHLSFQTKYLFEMRKRKFALLEAYYAGELEPISVLRDDFGVDFLIIDTTLYEEEPFSFAPFTERVEVLMEEGKENGFKIIELIDNLSVFQNGDYHVLDLHKLVNTLHQGK